MSIETLFPVYSIYIRKHKIGCGVGSMQHIFNEFMIYNISTKNVFISGVLPSKVRTTKKISHNDFKIFIQKYKKI